MSPVAASRPRVSRWGTYYDEPYRSWKKDTKQLFNEFFKDEESLVSRGLLLGIVCTVPRPKSTVLEDPNADFDNYAKAVCDALNGNLWMDDKQVRTALTHKQWTKEHGEPGRIELFVGTQEHLKELIKWFTPRRLG